MSCPYTLLVVPCSLHLSVIAVAPALSADFSD